MSLQNQPSAKPTRKMWAVILSGAIMGGLTGLANAYAPELVEPIRGLEGIITAAVAALAGYQSREWA